MNWIIYTILGGIGGLMTYLDWRVNKKGIHKKTKISKLVRNFCIGASVGGFVGTSTMNPYLAFISGTSGEFYLQRFGKYIEKRYL